MSRIPRPLSLAFGIALIATGLATRAWLDGAFGQHSGTALYASTVYTAMVFLWPRISPWAAGLAATGICWLIEFSQLTPLPAELSSRSVLARLVLGMQFDAVDLFWYPIGVLPVALLHWLICRDRTQSDRSAQPDN
jgi:hypothetical protein